MLTSKDTVPISSRLLWQIYIQALAIGYQARSVNATIPPHCFQAGYYDSHSNGFVDVQ